MLKIKDNVDLKELEKFGFKHVPKTKKHIYEIRSDNKKYTEDIPDNVDWITICDNDEILIVFSPKITNNDKAIRIDDTLYNLIKADLVEKIED